MKKKAVSLLLALALCLGLLPATASAAEAELPDWYFLFAIFKNVDADGTDVDGKDVHVTYSMTQEEVEIARENAREFEEAMNSFGVMRAHVDVVEIDETITKLGESDYGAWLTSEQAAPLLEGKVDLDKYDHVFCIVSLNDLHTSYLGLTGGAFENGTGHSCVNFRSEEYALEHFTPGDGRWPPSLYVHEYLHFMERLVRKWGSGFGLHLIGDKLYAQNNENYTWKTCYTDIILNRVQGDNETGTGVEPAAWRYPPHVLRTTTELTIPSGVTSIETWAFGNCTALTKVTIPASVTSIGYAAFWDTGIKDVYYGGTEAQWKAIEIDEYNSALTKAKIHYNSVIEEPETSKPVQSVQFTDVPAGAYYCDPVQWAVAQGVTAGTSDTTFSPDQTCTQGQILTFLWRAKGSPAPSGAAGGSGYYAAAMQWAKEQGIVSGGLAPDAPCTRADVVMYLWKLAGSPAPSGQSSFTDVPADADDANAVAWAVEKGVTAGTSASTFSPDSVCTRGQIVTFLYRALAG